MEQFYMTNPVINHSSEPHEFVSTGCFHGDHAHCNSIHGAQARHRPATCVHCDAKCRCSCHEMHRNAPRVVTPGVVEV